MLQHSILVFMISIHAIVMTPVSTSKAETTSTQFASFIIAPLRAVVEEVGVPELEPEVVAFVLVELTP